MRIHGTRHNEIYNQPRDIWVCLKIEYMVAMVAMVAMKLMSEGNMMIHQLEFWG